LLGVRELCRKKAECGQNGNVVEVKGSGAARLSPPRSEY
jgi:hypothetical protein